MPFTEFVLAFVTSALGAVGGLGGAVILVPLLVVTGMATGTAAPLGLVSVAAGSLAAGTHQLEGGAINHRIGIVTELVASAAAVVGALSSAAVGDGALQKVLGVVAIAAAVLGGRRKGVRNLPDPSLGPEDVGEHTGALSGVYRLGDGFVPYRARRVGLGLALFAVAGALAGLAGIGGGFIKTPATSEVMHVPVRVAAATTTFTIGITSAAGLLVFAADGRLVLRPAAAVCAGAILGGALGARLQSRLSPIQVRRALSGLLVAVGVLLLVRS